MALFLIGRKGGNGMCGVIGILRQSNVNGCVMAGLSRLQHRGQESAGIAIIDGQEMYIHKDLGLVSHVSREGRWSSLRGTTAIGHVRYSTKGGSTVENAGPIRVPSPIGPIAISYNGNLVNANQLRNFLASKGLNFITTTDTEVIAQCLVFHLQQGCETVEAIMKAIDDISGAYSLTILTLKGLYAVRDPNGIRPLCLGHFDDGYVVSSETCSLTLLGATFDREIERGEIIAITDEGISSYSIPQKRSALCIFEFIYLSRPDSLLFGVSVAKRRRRCGVLLAREEKAEGFSAPANSIAVPMPNTGLHAGMSWAREADVLPELAVIKDRYHPERTFIMPDEQGRSRGVEDFSIINDLVDGQVVYMVDDSIVRGTTKRGIVARIRAAGATGVHARIASPPYKFPCYYGVDTSTSEELAAASRTVEEIRELVGLDSLRYLSIEGLYQALGLDRELFCDGCLTGDYPVEIPDLKYVGKSSLES